MGSGPAELDLLTRGQRNDLRELLIRSTAIAGHPDDEPDRDLRRFVEAAPIDALPAAAALHRVGGTVLRGLQHVDGVPDAVRGALLRQRDRSRLQHLLLVAALGRIGRAFDDRQLAWLTMKGPVVAAALYPDAGDRSYADLDLLVGRRDFPEAMRVLEDLGYQHVNHDWADAQQLMIGEVGMTDGPVRVDLHWHLHFSRADRRPFALDPEAMITRRRCVMVSGHATPTFDPVDTLITLAFHAARSGGHRLIWLKDIERSVAVDEPDLDEVIRRGAAYRCAPSVGVMLGRARRLLGAEIPDAVVDALAPAAIRGTDRAVAMVTHPVQLHERPTICRAATVSYRSSVRRSISCIPRRAVTWVRRRLRPPRDNETDDATEKASYLRAVATAVER